MQAEGYSRWIAAGWACAVLALVPSVQAETITLTGEAGEATAEMEGSLVHDTYTRNSDGFRGRWSDKLYVQRDFPETGQHTFTALRFNHLAERIGDGRRIARATLVLEATNASGAKPIEIVAYPLLEAWDVERLTWEVRMHDGKLRTWNTNPTHFNLTPAASTAADTAEFDMAERHGQTVISAYAVRPDSDNRSVAEGMPAEFDVTNIVQLWYDGTLPNNGWALVAPASGNYVRFWASNGEGNGPKLVIELE